MKGSMLMFLTALLLGASTSWADELENAGAAYRRGEWEDAAKWYQLAAAQGHASAQFRLGEMYRMGQGIKQSNIDAVKWFRLAAAQGNAAAQGGLGLMYYAGDGVDQNSVRAYMWFNLASMSGYKMAVANMGILEKKMTSREIEDAKKLAQECKQSNFKGCK